MCLSKRVIQVFVWKTFITGTWCLISVLDIKPWAVQVLSLCVPMRLSPRDNTQRRSGPLLFGTEWSIRRMSTTVLVTLWLFGLVKHNPELQRKEDVSFCEKSYTLLKLVFGFSTIFSRDDFFFPLHTSLERSEHLFCSGIKIQHYYAFPLSHVPSSTCRL